MLDSFNLTQVQGNQADLVENALNLMRRMPIRDSGKNLDFLLNALPEHERELLASIDRPLEVLICNKTSQRFIAAEYNRHGNSYRSPWSGEYYPEAPGGYKPPDHIRELETYLNGAFKLYVKLYYDDGVSSVYAWELDTGFAVAILIKRG